MAERIEPNKIIKTSDEESDDYLYGEEEAFVPPNEIIETSDEDFNVGLEEFHLHLSFLDQEREKENNNEELDTSNEELADNNVKVANNNVKVANNNVEVAINNVEVANNNINVANNNIVQNNNTVVTVLRCEDSDQDIHVPGVENINMNDPIIALEDGDIGAASDFIFDCHFDLPEVSMSSTEVYSIGDNSTGQKNRTSWFTYQKKIYENRLAIHNSQSPNIVGINNEPIIEQVIADRIDYASLHVHNNEDIIATEDVRNKRNTGLIVIEEDTSNAGRLMMTRSRSKKLISMNDDETSSLRAGGINKVIVEEENHTSSVENQNTMKNDKDARLENQNKVRERILMKKNKNMVNKEDSENTCITKKVDVKNKEPKKLISNTKMNKEDKGSTANMKTNAMYKKEKKSTSYTNKEYMKCASNTNMRTLKKKQLENTKKRIRESLDNLRNFMSVSNDQENLGPMYASTLPRTRHDGQEPRPPLRTNNANVQRHQKTIAISPKLRTKKRAEDRLLGQGIDAPVPVAAPVHQAKVVKPKLWRL